jgi:hypothetical protein
MQQDAEHGYLSLLFNRVKERGNEILSSPPFPSPIKGEKDFFHFNYSLWLDYPCQIILHHALLLLQAKWS